MKALAVTGLAALLVTLGACGGGDDDKPQQPTPEVPVTPEPEQPGPTPESEPPVNDPFWPPAYSAQLPVSYSQPDADDAKFRGFLKPIGHFWYWYKKDADSSFERIDAQCTFDPAGLLTNDPAKPAKLTFGDKVFYDPAAADPASVTARSLARQQSFYAAAVTSTAPGMSFNMVVDFGLNNDSTASSYGLGASVLTPEGFFMCGGVVDR